MAISLKHAFASAKSDGADATLVQPSNWNAEHNLTAATDTLLGRATAGTGAVEEITCTAAGRALIDDADAAAQRTTLGLGTIATQAASSVAITGGTVTGISTLSTSGTTSTRFVNTADSATVAGLRIEGDRATPTNSDLVYQAFLLSDAGGTQTEVARISGRATSVTAGAVTGAFNFGTTLSGTLSNRMSLDNTSLMPFSNDLISLGNSSLQWSDLFLASGGVINFNNGDVTVTHSTNALAFAGASSGYTFDTNVNITGSGILGYGTGSGGTVTQATDKATGVTLSKSNGQIVTTNATLNANTTVTFTVTNTLVAATDTIIVHRSSGGTGASYNIWCSAVAAGSFNISIRNISAGNLSEALTLNFSVIKAVTS